MSETKVSPGGAFASFDNMSWPVPGERLQALEHQLRYGEPSATDLQWAASVISAYRQMVNDPRTKREHVVRTLRKVMSDARGKVSE